jgi:hypothetical protein
LTGDEVMSDALKILMSAIEEVNDGAEEHLKIGGEPDFVLMGPNAVADSLTLVRLFIAVERITEELVGKEITLIDDAAFDSEESHLGTVHSLTQHIQNLISDEL